MALLLWILSLILFLNGYYADIQKCPKDCECGGEYLDPSGIYCIKGNMKSIPIREMNKHATVVVITAPNSESSNYLTIGPIFVRPEPFVNLTELQIIYSNVPYIGENSFWGLKNLEVLDLSHNKITYINEKNFQGLYYLKYLNLEHNLISRMSSETFRNLDLLGILTLSYNQITDLSPRVFRNLNNLYELNLSGNFMKHLKAEIFKDLPNLNIFRCRSCNIVEMDKDLYSFIPNLKSLDLANNRIIKLSNDEFKGLRKLEVLRLEGNYLQEVQRNQFQYQNNLLNLNLSRNRIRRIDFTALHNLSKLDSLDISNNFHLSNLDYNIFKHVSASLTQLHLGSNPIPISEIELILNSLPSLRSVKLDNMAINELPSSIFVGNFHLKSINLHNNDLEQFPLKTLSHKRYIQFLDLSNNNISSLNDEELKFMESITEVNIDNNPWNCMLCEISTTLEYMDTTVLNQTIRRQVCVKPIQMKGKSFGLLSALLVPPCEDDPLTNESSATILKAVFTVTPICLFLVGLCYYIRQYNRSGVYYPNRTSSNNNNNNNK